MRTSTTSTDSADWYFRMLAPLNKEVKRSLISRLSASLAKKAESKKMDMSFFDGLTDAWDDGTPVEEEVRRIHEARTSGTTRYLIEF